MKILVTGASGFIGSFIVEKGLTEGHVIWAGMRATSSRNYLQDSRIRFVELDMEHPEILRPQLAACKAEFGGWDVIVHAAGATKCIRREDFFRTNTEGTRHFVDALRELDMAPGRFIFISSPACSVPYANRQYVTPLRTIPGYMPRYGKMIRHAPTRHTGKASWKPNVISSL